jgi:hypothetical protein
MSETRGVDGSIGRINAGPMILSLAAMVGIAYWCDRTYRRWLKENHPLAEHRARVDRLTTGYQRKRTNITEVVQVICDVLIEVARAASTGDAR